VNFGTTAADASPRADDDDDDPFGADGAMPEDPTAFLPAAPRVAGEGDRDFAPLGFFAGGAFGGIAAHDFFFQMLCIKGQMNFFLPNLPNVNQKKKRNASRVCPISNTSK
jgi:hypothetical protein